MSGNTPVKINQLIKDWHIPIKNPFKSKHRQKLHCIDRQLQQKKSLDYTTPFCIFCMFKKNIYTNLFLQNSNTTLQIYLKPVSISISMCHYKDNKNRKI